VLGGAKHMEQIENSAARGNDERPVQPTQLDE